MSNPSSEQIREAVEGFKEELSRTYDSLNELVRQEIENPIQPLMNFALNKKHFENRIKRIEIAINLLSSYLSLKDFPEEKDVKKLTFSGPIDVCPQEQNRGFNEALHLCKLAALKQLKVTLKIEDMAKEVGKVIEARLEEGAIKEWLDKIDRDIVCDLSDSRKWKFATAISQWVKEGEK
jgi:hypothetical protein